MPRNKMNKKKRMEAARKEEKQEIPTVKLLSSDGVTMEVPYDVIVVSRTIKAALEARQYQNEDTNGPIADMNEPIAVKVRSSTLSTVIHWCTHYKTNIFIPSVLHKRVIPAFDEELFRGMDQHALVDLATAAHELIIKGLTENIGRKIASIITGKSPEEIRRVFNIENDFTAAEEDLIRSENLADISRRDNCQWIRMKSVK